jgi:pimeloyl-ACP methyl ester carboxylesterase
VGTLILVHGAGGNGRLLAPLGNIALERGWTVVAPDLPAYGITVTREGWLEDYSEWPDLIADMIEREKGPVVLFGLSVGGMTALRAAQKGRPLAGVIATTLVDMAEQRTFIEAARWKWLGRLSLWLMGLIPTVVDRMPLPLALVTPLDAMTSDPELRRWFQRDPLIGAKLINGRFFRTLHQYVPPRDDFDLPCPLLLVHPGADSWTPVALSMPVFNLISSDKSLRILSNGSHMPAESPAWIELKDEVGLFLQKLECVN